MSERHVEDGDRFALPYETYTVYYASSNDWAIVLSKQMQNVKGLPDMSGFINGLSHGQ